MSFESLISSESLENHNFKEFTLDALLEQKNQGVNTTTEKVTYSNSGIPVIRANNITQGNIDFSDIVFVDQETFSRIKEPCKPRQGDVLYTNIGSQFGNAAKVTVNFDFAIAWNVMRLQPKQSVDSDFLVYLLNNPATKAYIRSLNSSSTMPFVSGKEIGKVNFSVPDLENQKNISATLRTLDDRIALLRETNATLEAIAQALFKSWFVDFDPVHAKQQDRIPEGMNETTAALFPDDFEESELGLVPKGWKVGKLEDLLVLQRGFDLPASNRVPGKYPIIAASGPSGTHKIAMAKAPGVVTGRSGVLGRVFLELEDYWPLNTTLWVKEFRAASPCYAYEVLSLLDFASFNAGSAVPTLNRNHVHSLPYLIPQRECIEVYESVAMMLHSRVRVNQHQAKTLAALRDTLLPRLISGQLRLPEAEALIEDVA